MSQSIGTIVIKIKKTRVITYTYTYFGEHLILNSVSIELYAAELECLHPCFLTFHHYDPYLICKIAFFP